MGKDVRKSERREVVPAVHHGDGRADGRDRHHDDKKIENVV